MRTLIPLIAALSAIASSACSSQQAYDTGQAWQRNQCEKMASMQDRDRCMSQSSGSYDNYKRETEKR